MWEYREAARLMTMRSVGLPECIYCGYRMARLAAQEYEAGSKRLLAQLSVCARCGWWSVYRIHHGEYARTAGVIESYSGTIGCLKELDLNDLTLPLNEVRQYLSAQNVSLYEIHPKKFEDVVCSVFKDCGWEARVTAYSGDDGIDVVLDGHGGSTVGVQVKRYKQERRIEAEQIRSFAGALLVNGYTRGVFVTTSGFRSGARKTANRLSEAGYPIELVDAERFLDALRVAQVNSFEIDDERYASYVLTHGVHLGSGLEQRLVPGEDLTERKVLARTWTGEDFISLPSSDEG